MRKSVLASVCSVLALLIVLAMGFFRVKTPHNIPFFVIYLVLMPFLSIAMTPLNKRLLAWRKARGRDLEEEEKRSKRPESSACERCRGRHRIARGSER